MGPSDSREQTGAYGAGAEVLHLQDAKFADKAIACGLIIAAATVSGFDSQPPHLRILKRPASRGAFCLGWKMLNFENLDRMCVMWENRYNIPEIEPQQYDRCEWIPFNFAKTEKHPEGKGLHFFLDDYQFCRLWNRPDDYISLLKRFAYVLSPDFSMYTDTPMALQIYNHYRKHWLAAYWQMYGIRVIPTICWSTPDSYDWCFDGEPRGFVVAVSTVGCLKNKQATALFIQGYDEMLRRLDPSQVIFYGQVPEHCDWNAIRIQPYYKKIEKARIEKHGR